MGRVLVLSEYFLPGYRGGGPIRSLARLIPGEARSHDVAVVTRDHDLGTVEPYASASLAGVRHLGASVDYVNPATRAGISALVRAGRTRRHDLVYLNSLWSPLFSVLPAVLLLARRRGPLILLAPRGECDAGALTIRARKKALAGVVLRRLLDSRRVVWHASGEAELRAIRTWMRSDDCPAVLASDIGAQPDPSPSSGSGSAEALHAVWISRIVPKKNALRFLHILAKTTVPVEARIYGPIEDAGYWESCMSAFATLPANVHCEYAGEVAADGVADLFRTSDVLLFPTLGESFGHVIAEALAVGCPVATTATTYFTDMLEGGAGRVFHTDEAAADYLRELSTLTSDERAAARRACWAAYADWYRESASAHSMFTEALGHRR